MFLRKESKELQHDRGENPKSIHTWALISFKAANQSPTASDAAQSTDTEQAVLKHPDASGPTRRELCQSSGSRNSNALLNSLFKQRISGQRRNLVRMLEIMSSRCAVSTANIRSHTEKDSKIPSWAVAILRIEYLNLDHPVITFLFTFTTTT